MADLAVWQRTIVDEKGDIIPGAEVSVRSYPGGSLITLYEGPDGVQVKGNPFSTGADGFARFWAESQRAEIVAHGAGSTIRWIVDLINADEVIGDAVSEATAAAAVAVGEAKAEADRAEAARDAAQLNAHIYEDTAAGLAATTDGDYFSVPSEDSDEYLILYRNDSGSATEVQRYPSAEAVDVVREDVGVQRGRTEVLFNPPSADQNRRPLVVTDYSFDLRPQRGYWADTGLPWLPGGEWDDLFPLTRLEVDDEEIIVTEWSFDLRPLRGYAATTGEPWPAIGGGGSAVSSPPMEVVFGTDQINVYIRQHGTTYVQWRIAHDVLPERNADIWRINGVFEATRGPTGYNQGQEICFDGEHEVAIRLKKSSGGNKPDHIGGRIHGNEELTDFYVLLDGVEVDHTVSGRHACERFEMVQASDMFEPGDTEETVWDPKGPKIMECYKHWLFTPQEGLRLAQRIDHIIGGFVVDNGYFGMLCLGWGTSGYDSVHTGAREPYWTRVDLGPGFVETLDSANHIRAWGDRYSGEVRVTRGWDSPGRNIHIDDRPGRRKIYPDFFEGDTTDTEQPWDVETVLNVTIKEEN